MTRVAYKRNLNMMITNAGFITTTGSLRKYSTYFLNDSVIDSAGALSSQKTKR